MRIVTDTNILVKGFSESDPETAGMLLHYFSKHHPEHMIVLDFGDVVRKEYHREVGHVEMFQKWYTLLAENQQIEYQDGTLVRKITNNLTELGFHEPSDQTFVALALKTDSTIVTEDSDYGKGKPDKAVQNAHVLQYMQDELELRVLDAAEASDFLSKLDL